MKKTFFCAVVAAFLCMSTARAQYTSGVNPDFSAQVAVNFPGDYNIGSFVCRYTGGPDSGFTAIEAVIVQKHGADTVWDYSHIMNLNMMIRWRDVYGGFAAIGPIPMSLVGTSSGLKRIVESFAGTISLPADSLFTVTVSAQLSAGEDTACSHLYCIGRAFYDTGHVTDPAVSANVYLDRKVLSIVPAGAPTHVIESMPQFSQVVGTFYVSANKAMSLTQINLQASGDINGYLPTFLNPRVVDSVGNTLCSVSGFVSSGAGFGVTPTHLDSGQRLKLYVLSDIMSATPGDNIRVQLSGGCGTIYPFWDVVYSTFFCMNENTPLGEECIYEPTTNVGNISTENTVLYPNPVADNYTISAKGPWTATIADITGRIVQKVSGVGPHEFSKGNLSGLYVVTIESSEQQVLKQKVLFQ